MEFNEKLKALRTQRGITQTQLAEAIFVSRSAVAKWENGLGLPSEESMTALQNYFGVSASYFATEQPEAIIVKKNRTINVQKILLHAVLWTVAELICAFLLLHLWGFRLTSEGAVDARYHPYPVIRTAEYDFYTNDMRAPTSIRAVKKYGFLYRDVTDQQSTWKYFKDANSDKIQISMKCYEGKQQNYYFVFSRCQIISSGTMEDGTAYHEVEYPFRSDAIFVNGYRIHLDLYTYFTFDKPIDSVVIKGTKLFLSNSTN